MKVFDLGCEQHHTFEGWFGSEEDYNAQRERGLLQCPMCGSGAVTRRLSAPRLNLRNSAEAPTESNTEVTEAAAPIPSGASPEARATMAVMQEAWMKAVRHVLSNTEDVGEKFAQEARRIHYGDAPERGIRGQASQQERAELLDEGIDVVPLPLPKGMGGPLQ